MTDNQKAKFRGESNQVYHIGRKSFPANVWIQTTPDDLAHLTQENVRQLFDFDPPVDFTVQDIAAFELPEAIDGEAEPEKKSKRGRRKKEPATEE